MSRSWLFAELQGRRRPRSGIDLARGRGHSPGFADIAIAATAHRHDLTILSRNKRHFAPMDLAVVDPFEKLPTDK